MKRNTVQGMALALMIGVLTTGCSTMNWIFGDWNYELGSAYSQNVTNMIANPDSIDAEARPVDGVDGRTGEHVMTQYERAQTRRQAAPTRSIVSGGVK